MLRDCFIFISNAFFNFCFHCEAEVTREPFSDNGRLKTFQSYLFYKQPSGDVVDLFSFGLPREDDSFNNDEHLAKCFDVNEPLINDDGTCNTVEQVLTVVLESQEASDLLSSFLDELRGAYSMNDINSIITCYFQ